MRDARWFLAGLIASGVMQAPFTNYSHFASAVSSGDGRAIAWIVAWVAHALSHGQSLFDANMFYPTRGALAHIEPMVSLGVIGSPIWLTTHNAILEYNLLKLLGPAVSTWAAARLIHAWTEDDVSAAIGGIAYGCSSFALLHNGHIQLTWSAGIPVALLAIERWWTNPRWSTLALWWTAALFTMLVSWYLALIVSVVVGLWIVWLLMSTRDGNVPLKGLQLFCATLLAVAVLLPFAAPYVGRNSSGGEAAAFAASWQSYLVPPEHTLAGRWLVARGWAEPQGIWGERSLFLGWCAIALACLGGVTTIGRRTPDNARRATFLIALALLAAGLSFGPSSTGFAPFDLFERLPGAAAFRASARFGLLVTLSSAVLAAIGLAWLRRAFLSWRVPIAIACSIAVIGEPLAIGVTGSRPESESMPEIYQLAVADQARAAVALPMYAGESFWFLEADYLLYSTSARFLRLGNGFGRWAPESYLAIGQAARQFPSPETAEVLRSYGITHVLLHGSRYGPGFGDLLARVREARDFTVVATRGSDYLLRLN